MPSMTPNAAANIDANASWITSQFGGSTYMPNNMDVQNEPIYDTLWNPATGAPYAQASVIPSGAQFFTAPTSKTLAQTNVQTAKKLDAPEAFSVMAIRFRISETTLIADVLQLYNNFVLEFWIGQKSYNRAPLWYYTPGGGLSGFAGSVGSVFTTGAAGAVTNGVPGRQAMHALQINIVIDNQASFFGQLIGTNVTLTATGSGGVGTNLMMLLDGLHARGVQ